MRIFNNWPQQAELMLSKPSSITKGGFACRWIGNVDMHMYATFDQNIPSGSRVVNIFINYKWMDGWADSHNAYSADPRVVQLVYTFFLKKTTFALSDCANAPLLFVCDKLRFNRCQCVVDTSTRSK